MHDAMIMVLVDAVMMVMLNDAVVGCILMMMVDAVMTVMLNDDVV